jgi:hypothetical protein
MRRPISKPFVSALAVAAACLAAPANADMAITFASMPTYGQPVTVQFTDAAFPMYLPATRYRRAGNDITIEYEFASDGFNVRPDFGNRPLSLGELPPGNYNVRAQLFDISNPQAAPKTVAANIPVVPPQEYGLYTVPMEPQAWAPTQVTLKSAVYFDVASMRASVAGNVIRVDFDYHGDAPVGSAPPAGTSSFASVPLAALQPGSYRLEGWGRAKDTGVVARYFVRDITVASSSPVIEYYSESLDHYFISAGPGETSQLDQGLVGDWKRTGQQFKGWLRPSDAPPFAHPVCRFFAKGPNSHFYTGDEGECQYLRNLEQQQRAQAAAQGKEFLGWAYEAVAFYAVTPIAGSCPGGTTAVYRSYNGRAAQNDSNHRFTIDPQLRVAMSVSWSEEGVAFCSPQ